MRDDDRFEPAARRETVLFLIACGLAGIVLAKLLEKLG
jgi:hypothetical protein